MDDEKMVSIVDISSMKLTTFIISNSVLINYQCADIHEQESQAKLTE